MLEYNAANCEVLFKGSSIVDAEWVSVMHRNARVYKKQKNYTMDFGCSLYGDVIDTNYVDYNVEDIKIVDKLTGKVIFDGESLI